MVNVFVVVNCNKRKVVCVTSSARRARDFLRTGFKIEVWADNCLSETIYSKDSDVIRHYVSLEKEYIGRKQKAAEERNKRKRMK